MNGHVLTHTTHCVLPINLYNDKIFGGNRPSPGTRVGGRRLIDLYHSAQIKCTMLKREFSLSFQMIKTKIMTPFKAPGNLLKIKSNHRSLA